LLGGECCVCFCFLLFSPQGEEDGTESHPLLGVKRTSSGAYPPVTPVISEFKAPLAFAAGGELIVA
jgi:hypothetical protein